MATGAPRLCSIDSSLSSLWSDVSLLASRGMAPSRPGLANDVASRFGRGLSSSRVRCSQAIAAVKASGLGLMKAVKAAKKTGKDEL